MVDNAGNTLRNAQDLDLDYGGFTRNFDRVTQRDSVDFYRIKVKPRSALTISVTGLRRAPNLRLLDADGDLFAKPQFSSPPVNTNTLQRISVPKGTYFIKVAYSGKNTQYRLNVGAFKRKDRRSPRNDPDGPGGPNNDLAPNRPQNGRPIPASVQPITYSDFVGPSDRVDFYQFQLQERRYIQAILFDLNNRANIALLDKNLNVVAAARDRGNDPREINLRVNKGQYYLRVTYADKQTRYSMTVSATPRKNPYFPGGGGGGGSQEEFLFGQIRDIFPGSASSIGDFIPDSARPETFTEVNGTLFFVADNGTFGSELWRSDGTEQGTQQVRDIYVGRDGSNPSDLVNVDGVLYFAADDGIFGRELWRSDGTEAGTELVLDLNVDRDSSNPADLVNFGGQVYFAADDGIFGREVHSYDPVADRSTVLDIKPGRNSSDPTELTVSGQNLFFAAQNLNGFERELWVSDGTSLGTKIININRTPNQGSNPSDLVDLNGTLYFAADDGIVGRELWESDGSTTIGDGTQLAANINVTSNRASSNLSWLANVGGTLYFAADDGTVVGRELYRYSPTDNDFSLVADINTTPNEGSDPTDLLDFDGTLIFAANDGTVVGREVYVSDSTSRTTRLAADINNTPNEGSDPSNFTVINGIVYFAADDGISGRELWGLARSA